MTAASSSSRNPITLLWSLSSKRSAARCVFSLSQPPRNLLAHFYCNSSFQSATESMNYIYVNPLWSRGCQRGLLPSSFLSTCHWKLSESVVQYLLKVYHPSSAISKGHNSKDTRQRTRCTLVSESSRSYCSTTVVQYIEKTTQNVRR